MSMNNSVPGTSSSSEPAPLPPLTPASAPASTLQEVRITLRHSGQTLAEGLLSVPAGASTREIESFLSTIRSRSGSSYVNGVQIEASLVQATGPSLQEEVTRLSRELTDERKKYGELLRQVEAQTFDSEPRDAKKKSAKKSVAKKPSRSEDRQGRPATKNSSKKPATKTKKK